MRTNPSPSATDLELALMAKDGNTEALCMLIDRHDPRLRRLCAAIAGSQADDAVQETWIRVMEAIKRFKPGSVSGWLSVIARNEALRAVSSHPHEEPDGELDLTPSEAFSDAYDHARRAELFAALERSLGKLPDPQRDAFVRDMVGEAPEDTKMALETSFGAIRVRRHRAREVVREALQPYDPDMN